MVKAGHRPIRFTHWVLWNGWIAAVSMTHWRTYHIKGLDMWDNPVEEIIEVKVPTVRDRLRSILIRILPWRLSYWLGISKWRHYSGIKAEDH